MILGAVQEMVLEALAELPADRGYGAALERYLSTKFDRIIQAQGIYLALHRLQRRGFLESEQSSPVPRGRRPLLYRLTPSGEQAVTESRRRKAAFP